VKRIQAAVEAGEITEEQAKERLDAYSKSLDQRVTKGVSVRKEE
jgi:ribosomal protein S20